MSISLSRYVNIKSQEKVTGYSRSYTTILIGRFFTANSLLPTGTFLQFSNAAEDVSTVFWQSIRKHIAHYLFGHQSVKNLTSAPAIQFASFVQNAVAPQKYSNT